MRSAIIAVAGLLLLGACNSKNDYIKIIHDPILFSKTVHELNSVVMGNNFSPIVAARNYTYASIAAYEVIAAGYPDKYESLAGQVHGLTSVPEADADKKIDFEFAAILAFSKLGEAVTFPEGSMSYYTDSLKRLARDHGMTKEVYNNSVDFADTISSVILKWSKRDMYLETRTYPKYNVIDTPGRWVPTPPAYTSAMEPHWKVIRPLTLDSC